MLYPPDAVAPILRRLGELSLPEYFRDISPAPSEAQLLSILNTAFAASLLKEEGRSVRLAMTWLDQEPAIKRGHGPMPFSTPLALTPDTIRRVAPAVSRQSGYLALGPDMEGQAHIWGLLHVASKWGLRSNPPALVIEILGPGTLIVRHVFGDIGALSGGRLTVFERHGDGVDFDLMRTVTDLLELGHIPPSFEAHCLLRIAFAMLRDGHGGALLVTPSASTASQVVGVKLRFALPEPGQSILPDQMTRFQASHGLVPGESWEAALARRDTAGQLLTSTEHFVAQLAGVDGAVLLVSGLRVAGFGAIIEPGDVNEEPRWHNKDEHPRLVSELGGTRHQSAARFCAKNPGAMALVVSQDGGLKLFTKSASDESVLVKGPFGDLHDT